MRTPKLEIRKAQGGFVMHRVLAISIALMVIIIVFTGCGSTDGGSTSVSGSVYYGLGFYDPWYYGAYYDDPDLIVTPPPGERPPGGAPPRPTHPIAKPPASSAPRPTPMPSIPIRPMPRGR